MFKFGGAALADGPRVQRVVDLVRSFHDRDLVLVVSAHHGVTELLDTLASQAKDGTADITPVRVRHRSLCAQLDIDPELIDRFWSELARLLESIRSRGVLSESDRDAVLSIGERVSARIVARAIRKAGMFATPVDVFDLGFVANRLEGVVCPVPRAREEVRTALEGFPGVPVVTGFLARTEKGDLTTLGPNGSDWTAAWLAEAIEATELVFWKSVPGFMTADPNFVADARVLESIAWDDAVALSERGAKILHPQALHPARKAGIPVTIRPVDDPTAAGTKIVNQPSSPHPLGITFQHEENGHARVAFVGGRVPMDPIVSGLRSAGLEVASHSDQSLRCRSQDLRGTLEWTHRWLLEQAPNQSTVSSC